MSSTRSVKHSVCVFHLRRCKMIFRTLPVTNYLVAPQRGTAQPTHCLHLLPTQGLFQIFRISAPHFNLTIWGTQGGDKDQVSASGLSHHMPGRPAVLWLVTFAFAVLWLAENHSGHEAQITRRCHGNIAEMGRSKKWEKPNMVALILMARRWMGFMGHARGLTLLVLDKISVNQAKR